MQKSEITVEMLEEGIAKSFELKKKHSEIKAEAATVWHEYELQNAQVGTMLEALDMDSYKAKAGTFSMKLEEGYTLPKDDESRKAFFSYLRDKGLYDSMITVAAPTLKSFVKAEVELAENEGNFEFIPPGVMRRDPHMKYSLRKK